MANPAPKTDTAPGATGRPPPGRDTKKTAQAAAALNAGTATKKRRIRFGRVLTARGLAVFTRQVATLVKAGMPIMRALDVLARQEKNVAFKEILLSISETIRAGGNFSDGLAQYPKVFDRLYINMVKAGEAGGVLDVVLDRLSKFLEKAEYIRGKIKAAMTYPIIIVFVATAIVMALMLFVVPKFQTMFTVQLKGQALPMLTVIVLNIANALVSPAKHLMQSDFLMGALLLLLIYGGSVIGLIIIWKLLRRTRMGTWAMDWMFVRGPVVGDLFLKAAIARFTRTFGTLLASGVPILQALTITKETSGNVHVAAAIGVVHDRVKEGDTVARPLEATAIFPGMVSSMIEVGEETGALPDMLTRIADIYDEEVDNAVASLTAIIEPIMIVLMAVVVGIIVLALFLPIIRIIELLGS
ncbi:MAG: type II secretion system F family protein [Opitutae bacterium]|nr:type II secretion system F family protein [Opitutae bacterium]